RGAAIGSHRVQGEHLSAGVWFDSKPGCLLISGKNRMGRICLPHPEGVSRSRSVSEEQYEHRGSHVATLARTRVVGQDFRRSKTVGHRCTLLKTRGILKPMPSLEAEGQVVRRQLERVLASPGFARNERLSRFLRFVVEGHLEGKDPELKESVIAVEVFGRSPGFDSRLDPVVRTEAVRLRARLADYYSKEGKADTFTIELPKGGYVPRFREISEQISPAAEGPEPPSSRRLRSRWFALGLGALVAALAIGGWFWAQQSAPIPIAVLPLENTTHDPDGEYFVNGLT